MKKQISENDWQALLANIKPEIENIQTRLENHLNKPGVILWWDELRDSILKLPAQKNKKKFLEAISSIKVIPMYLKTLINFVYDNPDHIKNFVKKETGWPQLTSEWQKANDFSESVLIIGKRLAEYLPKWQKLSVQEVVEDEVFVGLTVMPIEEQIYLEAKRMAEIKPYLQPKRKYRRSKK